PYTTLFRSGRQGQGERPVAAANLRSRDESQGFRETGGRSEARRPGGGQAVAATARAAAEHRAEEQGPGKTGSRSLRREEGRAQQDGRGRAPRQDAGAGPRQGEKGPGRQR